MRTRQPMQLPHSVVAEHARCAGPLPTHRTGSPAIHHPPAQQPGRRTRWCCSAGAASPPTLATRKPPAPPAAPAASRRAHPVVLQHGRGVGVVLRQARADGGFAGVAQLGVALQVAQALLEGVGMGGQEGRRAGECQAGGGGSRPSRWPRLWGRRGGGCCRAPAWAGAPTAARSARRLPSPARAPTPRSARLLGRQHRGHVHRGQAAVGAGGQVDFGQVEGLAAVPAWCVGAAVVSRGRGRGREHAARGTQPAGSRPAAALPTAPRQPPSKAKHPASHPASEPAQHTQPPPLSAGLACTCAAP